MRSWGIDSILVIIFTHLLPRLITRVVRWYTFADVMLHYLLSVIEGPEALPTKLIIICSPQSSMNPTQLRWVPYKYINNKKLASIEETLVQNYNPPTIIACLKTNTIRGGHHPWMPYSYVDHIFFHLLPIIPRLPYYWQEYTVNHTSYDKVQEWG